MDGGADSPVRRAVQCSGKDADSNLGRTNECFDVLHDFSQSVQENSGIMSLNRPNS